MPVPLMTSTVILSAISTSTLSLSITLDIVPVMPPPSTDIEINEMRLSECVTRYCVGAFER